MKKTAWFVLGMLILASGCQMDPGEVETGMTIKNATFDRDTTLEVKNEDGFYTVTVGEEATNIPYMLYSHDKTKGCVVVKDASGQEISRSSMFPNTFEDRWQSQNIYLTKGVNYIEFQDKGLETNKTETAEGVTVGNIVYDTSEVNNIASGGWKVYGNYEGTGIKPTYIYRREMYNMWFDFLVKNTAKIYKFYVIITDGPEAIKGSYEAYKDTYQDVSGAVKYSVDITGGASYKEQSTNGITNTPPIKYHVVVSYQDWMVAITPTKTYDLISDVDKNTIVTWKNASSTCLYDYLGVSSDKTSQYFLETRKSDYYKTLKKVPVSEVTHNYIDGYWKKTPPPLDPMEQEAKKLYNVDLDTVSAQGVGVTLQLPDKYPYDVCGFWAARWNHPYEWIWGRVEAAEFRKNNKKIVLWKGNYLNGSNGYWGTGAEIGFYMNIYNPPYAEYYPRDYNRTKMSIVLIRRSTGEVLGATDRNHGNMRGDKMHWWVQVWSGKGYEPHEIVMYYKCDYFYGDQWMKWDGLSTGVKPWPQNDWDKCVKLSWTETPTSDNYKDAYNEEPVTDPHMSEACGGNSL